MLMIILSTLNRYKFWLLLLILLVVVGSMRYFHRREVIGLEGVVASVGLDIVTCRANLALCEQNFKELAGKCRLSCPGMAEDINALERDYGNAKKELEQDRERIKKLLVEVDKLKEERIASGAVAWAESPEELERQLREALGDQWSTVVERIRQESGLSQIGQVVGGFRWYPKWKLGIGYDLNQVQVQVGASLFSYGKIRSIDRTVFDFVQPYVSLGMQEADLAIGVIPVSFNLGSIKKLPVRDLDLAVGVQYSFDGGVRPALGITSTF